MDERMKRLIAIGASVGANCHPCVEYHINKAIEQGIEKSDINKAVETAKAVRRGAATSLDTLVQKLLNNESAEECGKGDSPCCCS